MVYILDTVPIEVAGFAGLNLRANPATIDDFLSMLSVGKMLQELDTSDPEGMGENVTAICHALARQIASWELQGRDGDEVPISSDAVKRLGFRFLQNFVPAWTDAMVGVSDPLGDGSTSGESFQEELLPMEALSPSLEN